MLLEHTLFGTNDKVAIAIQRLQAFEPPEGYYLAFSGGKDSQCIYHLAIEAGVKFDAHYNLTTVDPPELVKFIKRNYPDVIIDKPKFTMWQLIVKNKIPPTRKRRYCCTELKEIGGKGRICLTGVRWAESAGRKKNRNLFEIIRNKKILLNDNDEDRRIFENCAIKGKRIVNPIIDWLETDVWEYLNSRKIPYCSLYDEGFKRLGCIGCQLAGTNQMKKDFERWPKYKEAYLRCFNKMLDERKRRGLETKDWETAEDVMEWWLSPLKQIDDEQPILDF